MFSWTFVLQVTATFLCWHVSFGRLPHPMSGPSSLSNRFRLTSVDGGVITAARTMPSSLGPSTEFRIALPVCVTT